MHSFSIFKILIEVITLLNEKVHLYQASELLCVFNFVKFCTHILMVSSMRVFINVAQMATSLALEPLPKRS